MKIYCPRCLNKLKKENKFCNKCGYEFNYSNLQNPTPKRKNKFLMTLIIIAGIFGTLITISVFMVGSKTVSQAIKNISNINATNTQIETKKEILIDVNQFARITPKELVAILGETEEIENLDLNTGKGTFKTTIYTYVNYEFIIIDNAVVRMNIHSNKYNDKNGDSIKYKNNDEIFNMLNITPSKNIVKISDTETAIRYQSVSDKVAEAWIPIMSKKDKTIDEIKITYNLNYFI